MSPSTGPHGIADPAAPNAVGAAPDGIHAAPGRPLIHDGARQQAPEVDAHHAPPANSPGIARAEIAARNTGVHHAAMLLNKYESAAGNPAMRRHCVVGLRSVMPMLDPQEREAVRRDMQATSGKYWRSILGVSRQRPNNYAGSALGTVAGPLRAASGFSEGLGLEGPWAEALWAAGGIALTASTEYVFRAPEHWTQQFAGGLTHGFANSSMPHDWKRQVGTTLAVGSSAGHAIKWVVDTMAEPALEAAVRDVWFTPRVDSAGVDRTPEVADLVFQLLAMVTDLDKRKHLSLALAGSMAIDAAFSRALADFASSSDPAARTAALDVIGLERGLEQSLSEAGPFPLREAWGMHHLQERCFQTEYAMAELWPSPPDEQFQPSLSDPQNLATIAQRLGHHQPLHVNDGLLFYETLRRLPELHTTISPPNVLRRCLNAIAAVPARLDGIIASVRDQLSAQE
jgi:hypothetical protein